EFRGSEAVTFQVLPKGDGLELFISKNLPDEEISQSEDSTVDSEDVSDFLRQQIIGSDPEEELSGSALEEQERQATFAFVDFEQ
ncbi:adaptor protein MecA, partial [Enterococcus faecalis]|uniref:adaptor protein MecA n=1 Tax=Enterococcus faecalis TaxID=1351 RepID=UPI00403F98B8